MIQKFTKRQLLDQCGFTAKEVQVILDYQKKLPILSEDNDTWINAKDLWEQLSVQKKYTDWIKNQIKTFDLIENSTYLTKSLQREIANNGTSTITEYYIQVETAKSITLVSGYKGGNVSKELKENSKLAHKYFILMEKAVKRNIEWELIRYPLREGYKKMQDALNQYMNRMIQKNADDWDYKIEADALNVIATGFPAKEIRLFVGCKDNITRDSLTATYNEYLMKLQELNIVYLGMNMNRYDRYKMLKQSFDILFPNAVPIKDDIDMNRIQANKQKLLDEVKEKVQGAA